MIELKSKIEEIYPNKDNMRDKEYCIGWGFADDPENREDAIIAIGIQFNSSKLHQLKEKDMETALRRINSQLKQYYKESQCKN